MLKKSLSVILAFAVVLSTLVCGPAFSASAETEAIYVDAITLKAEDASEYGFADFAYVDQTGADYEVTVDPEHMYKIINGLALNSNLPESYDSKEYGYVTSVKNQGASGNCWSFSMMSALESNGITEGIADENTNLCKHRRSYFKLLRKNPQLHQLLNLIIIPKGEQQGLFLFFYAEKLVIRS